MNEDMKSAVVFTPAAVMELLASIDELKDKNIGITETLDDKIQLQIDSSIYEISAEHEKSVDVPDEVVDQIDDINQESYEKMSESLEEDIEIQRDAVEGGIIKELAKSLLLGGMIRLSGKLLK